MTRFGFPFRPLGLLLGLVVLLPLASPALAAEIFVPPAAKPAGNLTGNYPVLVGQAITDFAFVIPDDFTSFVSAKVVLIPAAAITSPNFNFTLGLSVAKNAEGN